MSRVTIRRAEARDVPALLELVRELARFEKEPDAVTVTEAQMHEAGFGAQPVWLGWVAEERVAEEGGSVIGMAICYLRYSTWRGTMLFLEDLYVRETHRGKGVGERLLRTAIEHATAQGYPGLRWQVLDWNEGAVRFYQRFGARIDRGWWNVDLPLTPPGGVPEP